MSGRPLARLCEACDEIATWSFSDGYDACDKCKREQEDGCDEGTWDPVTVPTWLVEAYAKNRGGS